MLALRLVPAPAGSPTPAAPETGTGLAGLGLRTSYRGNRRPEPELRQLSLRLRLPEADVLGNDPFPILF